MSDIDTLLRDHARAAIADEGFSTRVLGALPRRSARSPSWWQPVLVLGSAAVGCVLALLLAPGHPDLLQGFADLVHFRGLTPAAATGIGIAGALLASALVLAADPD